MPNEDLQSAYNKLFLNKSEPSTSTSVTATTGGTSTVGQPTPVSNTQTPGLDLSFRDIPKNFQGSLTFINQVDKEEHEPLNDIFKSALSNEYTSALKTGGTTKGFAFKKWGELESTAKELYDHVKTQSGKRFTTEEQVDAYNQKTSDLRNKFNSLRYDAENSLYLTEDGKERANPLMFFDKDTEYKLMNQSDFDLVSQKPVIRRAVDPNEVAQDIQFENNWRLTIGMPGMEDYYGTGGVGIKDKKEIITPEDSAYKQFRVNEESASDNLNAEIKPILNNWITSSFDLLDKSTDSEWTEGKVTANKYNLVGLADTLAMMGAKSGNAAIKKEAQSLMVGIERARAMNPDNQNDSVIKFIKGKKESLENITNSLVSSNAIEAYNSYKNSYFLPDYWADPKTQSKSRNVIDKYIRVRQETLDASEKYRTAVIETMGNDMRNYPPTDYLPDRKTANLEQMIFDQMFTKTNRVKSKDAVLKAMRNAYGETSIAAPTFSDEKRKVTLINATDKGLAGEARVWDRGFTEEEIETAYNSVFKKFKKQFAKTEVSTAMKNSGMVYGMTYNRSQFIGWNSVDMSNDGEKRNTVDQVSAIINSNLNVNKDAPLGNVIINKGGYVANATVSQVKGDRTEASMKKIYDDFFNKLKTKDGAILPFDVDFSPVSNLENKALYIFRAKMPGKEKQEQISIYVDKDLPQLKEDHLFKNTQTEPADWSFKLDGEWNLNHLKTEGVKPGTDVKIKLDKKNNMKYLHAHLWNADKNMFVEVKRPLTDVNMSRILDNEKDIQKMLNAFGESYRASKSEQ